VEVARVKLGRWFLPDTPDVLGMLYEQVDVTVEGMAALHAWADGDGGAEDRLRDAEHRADEKKRDLWRALRNAYTTPIDAEDLFALSSELDESLNLAKDVVREAESFGVDPDDAVREMAENLDACVKHLAEAFRRLDDDQGGATTAADEAMKSSRHVERIYRRVMPEVAASDDLRAVMLRGDLYRRLLTVADGLVRVAERVWYAVVKEG
jgi:uncharacterized protein